MNESAIDDIIAAVFSERDMPTELEAAVMEWRDASKAMSGLATSNDRSADITFNMAMRRYTDAEQRLMQLAEALGE